MDKITIQHDELRKIYSEILLETISTDQTLKCLNSAELQKLHQELTKWFGTSPPETSRVKNDFKKIIENNISLDEIPGTD
jgi:hypothetical protein